MGAGRQRWWMRPSPAGLQRLFDAWQRQRDLQAQGLWPMETRVHSVQFVRAAGLPCIELPIAYPYADDDPSGGTNPNPGVAFWAPVWTAHLMNGTWQHGNAAWRLRMLRWCADDEAWRASALSVLRINGADGLCAMHDIDDDPEEGTD